MLRSGSDVAPVWPGSEGSVPSGVVHSTEKGGLSAAAGPPSAAGQPSRGLFLGLARVPAQCCVALAAQCCPRRRRPDSAERWTGVALPLPSGMLEQASGRHSTHARAHDGPEAFSWLKPPS